MYLGQMDVRTGRTSMQMYLENLGQKSKKPGGRSRQKNENRKLARRDERIVSGDRIILRRILPGNQTGGIHDDRCYF